MKKQQNKVIHWFIIGTFVMLYILVSLISTIHVIEFFELSNDRWLAITLAIAFEIGASASLASIIVLDKMNKWIVWSLFFILTAMQGMGNTYYAFSNLHDYQGWIDLFGLNEEEPLYQKRILSIVSGAILPLVALGFIKSLVDYIKPNEDVDSEEINKQEDDKVSINKEDDKVSNSDKSSIDIDSLLEAALQIINDQKLKSESITPELLTDSSDVPIQNVQASNAAENMKVEIEEKIEEPVEVNEKYSIDYSINKDQEKKNHKK